MLGLEIRQPTPESLPCLHLILTSRIYLPLFRPYLLLFGIDSHTSPWTNFPPDKTPVRRLFECYLHPSTRSRQHCRRKEKGEQQYCASASGSMALALCGGERSLQLLPRFLVITPGLQRYVKSMPSMCTSSSLSYGPKRNPV